MDCKGNGGTGDSYKLSRVTEGKGVVSLQGYKPCRSSLGLWVQEKVNVKNEYGQTSRTGDTFSGSAFLLQNEMNRVFGSLYFCCTATFE